MNDITPIRPAGIAFRDVNIVFEDGTRALHQLSLDIREGELVVLVGPSGCGKSTALRALAGLEEVSSGQITIGARDVTDLDPQDRDIAMVFQNYALYPHKTIYENLAYPLRVRRVQRTELDRRVRQTAELLALTPFLHRKPRALSGGQRQRVAMGRALVREPVAFLMDEPLSNLDAALRVEMRTEILALHRKLGVTTVYVTHDQVEAMTMGDRVAVMRGGVLQQFDTPQALYDRPRNLFVGSFVGSPATNLAMGRVATDGSSVEIGGQTLKLPLGSRLSGPLAGRAAGSAIVVGIRPEAFEHASDGEHDGSFVVTPSLVEFLGSELFVHFKLGQASTAIVEDGSALPRVDGVAVGKPFVARLGPRSGLAAGQPTTLWFRSRDILLFDAEDGNRVD